MELSYSFAVYFNSRKIKSRAVGVTPCLEFPTHCNQRGFARFAGSSTPLNRTWFDWDPESEPARKAKSMKFGVEAIWLQKFIASRRRRRRPRNSSFCRALVMKDSSISRHGLYQRCVTRRTERSP